MITPTLKDQILKELVAKTPLMKYSSTFENEAGNFNINKEIYQGILQQFDKRGFVNLKQFTGGSFFLTVNVGAHDYILGGGHVAEIDMIDTQLQKLKLEMFSLEKSMDHQSFERITGIINTLTSFWTGILISK